MLLLFGFYIYMMVTSWAVYKVPLIYQGRHYRRDRLYITITLGILLLMTCLRGMSVGNDTSSYYAMFRYYGGLTNTTDMSLARILWLDNMEIGYRTLNYLVHRITDNYQIFLSIVACFSYVVVIRFIKRYSSNVSLSCVLFFLIFYGAYMNLFRQVLAMSIVLLAFDWLNREKYLRFGIAVFFIAVLFHRTAIVALLLIPMAMFRGQKLLFWIAGAIAVVLVAFGRIPAIVALLEITSSYTSQTSGISIMFSTVMNSAYLLVFLFLRQGECDVDQEVFFTKLNPAIAKNLISWIPYVCLLISVVAFAIPVATRVELYFTIFYLILLPEMLHRSTVSNSNKQIVVAILIFALLVNITGRIIYRPEWVTEYNYTFFWQNQY